MSLSALQGPSGQLPPTLMPRITHPPTPMRHPSLALAAAIVAAAALAFAPPGRATEAARYSGAEWSTLDLKQVEAEASEVTLARLPDCDDATVDQKSMRVVHEDGTAEMQDEVFTKVLTEKGRRNNDTLSLNFLLPYMTVSVPRLEIIRANGDVVPVDVAANSKESIDESQMQENIYDPNSKVLKVNIPKLEIGDIVHSVIRITVERPFMPGEYAEDFMMEGSGYIRHISIEIRMPSDKPLRQIALRDETPGTVSATTAAGAGSLVYHWEVNRVPRMFDEPAMPPYPEVLQHLSVSTTADWAAVSRWYWDLSKPHLDAITPAMKKQVAELTAGSSTDMERIKAVFYYVSKKIRYMGITPEKDRPGFEPHDVEITYEKKYGVCRDKAALLVSLLRAAGQNAYPVLVSVGWKKDPQVPNPFFNHAIVGVELGKGRYVLMDPTDENTRDLLPTYDDNQSYLVCRTDGETLRLSPVDPPENSMMRIATTGTLSATGALEAHSHLSFDGINDNAYRQAFAQMKPDDRRRFFEAQPQARDAGGDAQEPHDNAREHPRHLRARPGRDRLLRAQHDGVRRGQGRRQRALDRQGPRHRQLHPRRDGPGEAPVPHADRGDVRHPRGRLAAPGPRLHGRGVDADLRPAGRRLRGIPAVILLQGGGPVLLPRHQAQDGGVLAGPVPGAEADAQAAAERRPQGARPRDDVHRGRPTGREGRHRPRRAGGV